MAKKLYCLKDIKAISYLPPFPADHHVDATRQVQQNARHPGTTLAEYPEDFEVYYLGEFDQQNGTIKSINPEFLTSVGALVELQNGK